MNWKGFGRKRFRPNRDTIPAFSCWDRGKSRNPSGRIAGALVEILSRIRI
jgi:hypothetical protein